MKKIMQLLGLTTLGLMTTLTMNSAQAKQTFCVFDLVGTQGDVYALMKDYQLASKNGVQISSLKPTPMSAC